MISKNDLFMNCKSQLRLHLKQVRQALLKERRHQSASLASAYLFTLTKQAKQVLSYASFGTELDLWPLNKKLIDQGKLILPKMESHGLRLFRVKNLAHLNPNGLGILEPIPSLCEEVSLSEISLVFVPGLGFDLCTSHRLGYGKGYYDRLLQSQTDKRKSWGVGFKEQSMNALPISLLDVPLNGHLLF